jgi:hypothetical protein
MKEFLNNLGKLDLVVVFGSTLTYEDELCPSSGELSQRIIDKRILKIVCK